MFQNLPDIAPATNKALFAAADAAVRAIPPAFPLDATVAVNPFLGQAGEDLAHAATRLGRVGGVRLTRERAAYAAMVAAGTVTEADLSAALDACSHPLKPSGLSALKTSLQADGAAPAALPTVADLAARATGTDWPAIIARCLGLWAAGYFDRGQALWTPAPGASAFAAWREWATHDLTPELAGLTGFCRHIATCPDTTERALIRAAAALALDGATAETAYHRLLVDLGGWAQHARWLLWQAELTGRSDSTLADLLTIRMLWEEALLAHVPTIAAEWSAVLAAHARPVEPDADTVLDCILQDAAERAHQRGLAVLLPGVDGSPSTARPLLQAAFCIDVRSEPFRRALESLDPGIATLGFAGFFGLPVAHRGTASDLVEARLPVLLTPRLLSQTSAPAVEDTRQRIAARAVRALTRFRQAAVSSFAFVEAAGPLYGAKLLRDALGLGHHHHGADAHPILAPALPAAEKAAVAAQVLKAMSLTRDHARLVLLLGHGATVTNNPHESAYHCGACGGHKGDVSARLLAALLNDAETRAGLPAHGIDLPADTLFLAGLHNTVTDQVTLYKDAPRRSHEADIAAARTFLDRAARQVRLERAERWPGATANLAARARNWAEVRPEWGLAGCAAFIAAPRAVTAASNLKGRAFLHSYDWQADAGFGTLELILTAPVVVASWISLQYYGSAVAPAMYGGGDKLIHNVTAGIGVVEGNGGRLRAGLPWQAVHDGDSLAHAPLRLSVMVEAPRRAIADILTRHPQVRALFDNGWLSLFVLEKGVIKARWRPGADWGEVGLSAAA